MCRGGHATFNQCQFQNNEMLGLEVAFFGARVELHGCKFSMNMEHGVSAYAGASLYLNGCEVSKSHRVGISVLDDSTQVALTNCDIADNRHEGILACSGVQVSVFVLPDTSVRSP